MAGTDPSNSDKATVVCVGSVCTRSSGCLRARICACVRSCVRVSVRDVFAIYDNNV